MVVLKLAFCGSVLAFCSTSAEAQILGSYNPDYACVGSVKHAGNKTTVCTNNQTSTSEVTQISQLNQANAQTSYLKQIADHLSELKAANQQLRDTLQQVVVKEQTAMRNDVVAQLSSIPGQVATNPAVIDTLAAAIASRLASDTAFTQGLAETIGNGEGQ